jgi:hypothetical protein
MVGTDLYPMPISPNRKYRMWVASIYRMLDTSDAGFLFVMIPYKYIWSSFQHACFRNLDATIYHRPDLRLTLSRIGMEVRRLIGDRALPGSLERSLLSLS